MGLFWLAKISSLHLLEGLLIVSHDMMWQKPESKNYSGVTHYLLTKKFILYLLNHFFRNNKNISWWHHRVETFSVLLALCEGNPPVTGGFPSQRPVTQSFDVFFDLCQNELLSKQSRHWWLEIPSRSLWRHCNAETNIWTGVANCLCSHQRVIFVFISQFAKHWEK